MTVQIVEQITKVIYQDNGNILIISDGVGPQGPPGPEGPQGPAGTSGNANALFYAGVF